MKTKLLLTVALIFSITSFAKEVDVATAMNIAKNFYIQNVPSVNTANKLSLNFTLAYECKSETTNPTTNLSGQNLYYIFNINTNDGFVIVSGDDVVVPILGYSNRTYDANNNSPEFQYWMDRYKKQIISAIENKVEATNEIKAKWSELTSASNSNQPKVNATASVNPLLQNITWNQGNTDAGGFYNDLCPSDPSLPNASCNLSMHCVTGCPATAMGQIMKFWDYPTTGSGFHSYNHPVYGTLTANFGGTTYNWSAMPDNVTSTNIDVATLMYQCGVSVEMQYGPCGSGGYIIINNPTPQANSEYAYKTYFGYDSTTVKGVEQNNYTDADWENLLTNELDNGRPIQYAGFEPQGGGHTWVCDGYSTADYFHMNWGWGGSNDGYFYISALNTTNGDFNPTGQQAVIGIQPASGGTLASIDMYSSITITPNPINFNASFTVNADIVNSGSSTFNGDYCAALFDSTGNFIDYVQTYTGNTLQSGYHYTGGINFVNSGILTVPGTYIIGIYYRPTGGNWYLAGNTSYANPIYVTISSPLGNTVGSPNNLELYSSISPSPTTFVQGQAASVSVNFANYNNYTYFGQLEAALYDLSGNFVETIGSYTETAGLQAGYAYTNPLTFSTSSVTASPGTYILAIVEEEQGDTTWYYVGGDYYTNPVNIDVVAAALSPDIYEPDNTQATAYNLPLTWSSNSANPKTTGSNIHVDTDIDYYQIILAAGYNYTITARADDSYSSGNGNTYTCDVIWSYDAGSGWSAAYDDVMPGNIQVNGAGTVVFEVSPYFPGETGTYLLDINITRTLITGIGESELSDFIKVYPNPSNGIITISSSSLSNNFTIKVSNVLGEEVYQSKMLAQTMDIDLSKQSNGIYFVQINSEKGSVTKKMIIAK